MNTTVLRGHSIAVLKWLVSLGLVGLLVWLVDLPEVYQILRSADLLPLVIALGIALGDRFLMAGKWFPLVRVQLPDVGFGRAVRAYLASNFAGAFLPASVGGSMLRAVGVGRDQEAIVEVGASVALERVLGLIGSGVMALLALGIALKASVPVGFLAPWALTAAGLGVLVTVAPFSARVRRWLQAVLGLFQGQKGAGLLERFGTAYGMYRDHTGTLLVVGILSIVEQMAPVLMFWASAQALHLELSFQSLLVAVPLTVFAARLPISIAGVGISEGGLVYLLGLFGAPASQVLSLAVVGRVIGLSARIPGAFWWGELIGSDWSVSRYRRREESDPNREKAGIEVE